MGSDDLFHKRKKRGTQALTRRRAKRAPYARILVVCEGKKTEPNYFNGLKNDLHLNSANVEITGDSDSSPTSVVAFSKERYRDEEKAGSPFNRVFCVFDKNNHSDYERALTQIKKMKPDGVFQAITSVPAFEYYLLLHYIYSTKPCTSAQALSDLKKHIRGYQKGKKNIFTTVHDKLETATINAKRSLMAAVKNGTDNPSTKVHKLVEFMQNIHNRP